eukprot:131669_1
MRHAPYYQALLLFLAHLRRGDGQRYVPATIMAWCDNDLSVYSIIDDGAPSLIESDEGSLYRVPITFQITPMTPNTALRFHCKDLGGGGGFAASLLYLGINYTTNYPITASMFDLVSSDDNITDLSTLRYEQREGLNYSNKFQNVDQFDLAPYWVWNDNILNTMVFEFDFSKMLAMTEVKALCNNYAEIFVSLPGLSGRPQMTKSTPDTTWPEAISDTFMVASESTVEVKCVDTTGTKASFMGAFKYLGNWYPTKNPVNSPTTSDWLMTDGQANWYRDCDAYNVEYGSHSRCGGPGLTDAYAVWTGVVWKENIKGESHIFRIFFNRHYNYSSYFHGPYTLNPTPSPTEHVVCTNTSSDPACNRYEYEEFVGVCEDIHDLYSSGTKSTGLSPFVWFCIIFSSIIFSMLMFELLSFLIWKNQDEEWRKEHDWFIPGERVKTMKKSLGRVTNGIFHFIVLFWCLLATFYGVNQLYRLSYSNFWCEGPPKTVEEIHEYNLDNHCKTGDKDSCYQTDAILDFYKVRTDNPADLWESEEDITPENTIYAVLFFILGVVFLLLSILHLIKLYKSCKHEIDTGCCECCICFKRNRSKILNEESPENKDETPVKPYKKACQNCIVCDCRKYPDDSVKLKVKDDDHGNKTENDKDGGKIQTNDDNKEDEEEACPMKCVKGIIRFYKTHLELDSTFSIQFMIFGKFFNIIAQIIYLCALGGTSLMYVLTGNNKEVILAEYPEFIYLLSRVIFCDCFCVCILWILYGALPHIFYAHTFKFLNIFIDLTFKLIYSLFPIIVHGTLSHFGLFQFKSFGRFFGPFAAMLFMVWRVHKILGQSRDLAETGDIINHQLDNTLGAYDDVQNEPNGLQEMDGMDGLDPDGEELALGGKSEEKERTRRHWNVDNYMDTSVYRWNKLTDDKYGKDYLAQLKESERLEAARNIWVTKHKRKMAKAKREGRLEDLALLQKELDAKLAEDYSVKNEDEEKGGFGGLEKQSDQEQVFKYSFLRGPYWEKYDANDQTTKQWNHYIFHCDDVEDELRKMFEAQKERKTKEEEMEKKMQEFREKQEEEERKSDKKKKSKKAKNENKDQKEMEVALSLEMVETSDTAATPTNDDKKKRKKRTTSKATKPTKLTKSDDEDKNKEKGPSIPSMNAPRPRPMINDDDNENKKDKKSKKKKRTLSKTTKSDGKGEETTELKDDGEEATKSTKREKRTTSKATKSSDDDEKKKPRKSSTGKKETKYEAVKELSPSPNPNSPASECFDDEFDEFREMINRVIWCNRLKRCWLFFAALLYLSIGLVVIILVHLDLDGSHKFCTQIPTANLPNLTALEWELIAEHPDLALYNEACKIQVYELFGSYPCNCRLFDLYLTDDVDSICILKDNFNANTTKLRVNDYVGASLTKWTMIERYLISSPHEELSCLRYDGNSIIDLDHDELFEAKYMQVMVLGSIQISAISPAIAQYINLAALFIEYIDGFADNTTMPWNEIGNLPLKVFRLRGIDADIHSFPVGLCNLKEDLIYFGFQWTKLLNVSNCLGEFQKLQYFKFSHNRITNIPWDLLQLNNVRRISFPGNSMEPKVFNGIDKNINFSSSLIELDFLWNNFCENVTLYTNNDLIIDGCQGVCTKDYNSLYCNNNMIGDGVCQSECNTKTCLFDEGDCIQLCNFTNCDVTTIGNGECNEGCNNIECRWDGGDCDTIYCSTPDYLNSYIAHPLWLHVDDGVCDLHLLASNCSTFEHEADCQKCSATCDAMYLPFLKLSQGDEIITVDDWCNEELWVLVQQQLNKANIDITDCTFFVNDYRFDLNGNGVTGFHEFLYLFGYNMQAKPQGIEQADCRKCMDHPDLYYQ